MICIIIAIDLDNVLNNYVFSVIDKVNIIKDTSYTIEDMVEYNVCNCLNLDVTELHQITQNSSFLNELQPIQHCYPYLEELNNLSTIYIVTARTCYEMLDVYKWVQNNFPFLQENQIIRCCNKELINADILIDDCLQNIINFPRGRILLDYPYNKDIDDKEFLIHRVCNWTECFSSCCLMLGLTPTKIKNKIKSIQGKEH